MMVLREKGVVYKLTTASRNTRRVTDGGSPRPVAEAE